MRQLSCQHLAKSANYVILNKAKVARAIVLRLPFRPTSRNYNLRVYMSPARRGRSAGSQARTAVWAKDGNRFQIMKKAKSGFSLVELCTVMAVMLIVAAMAFPSVRRSLDAYRLNSSANRVKDMLLQAQAAAKKANEPYYAQVNGGDPMLAAAQSASGGGSNPTAMTSGSVTLQPAGPGNINDLLNALGGIAPQPPGTPIGFNARGLPCVAPNPASPYICPGPTGFIWYMQNVNGDWAAVTVSPAGRIRSWHRTSTNANGAWQ